MEPKFASYYTCAPSNCIYHCLPVSLKELYLGTQRDITYFRNNGNKKETVSFSITVPPCSLPNTFLYFPNCGNKIGNTIGNLAIILELDTHPLFILEGPNVYLTLDLTNNEAVDGFEHIVEYLNGEALIIKKTGLLNSNDEVIFPGYGFYDPINHCYGSLIVKFNIIFQPLKTSTMQDSPTSIFGSVRTRPISPTNLSRDAISHRLSSEYTYDFLSESDSNSEVYFSPESTNKSDRANDFSLERNSPSNSLTTESNESCNLVPYTKAIQTGLLQNSDLMFQDHTKQCKPLLSLGKLDTESESPLSKITNLELHQGIDLDLDVWRQKNCDELLDELFSTPIVKYHDFTDKLSTIRPVPPKLDYFEQQNSVPVLSTTSVPSTIVKQLDDDPVSVHNQLSLSNNSDLSLAYDINESSIKSIQENMDEPKKETEQNKCTMM